MNWSKVGGFLKSSLPVLGMALTGNVSGAIGSLVSSAMGVEDSPKAVMNELKNNPEAILKYKLAELESNKEVIIASQEVELKILQTVNHTMQVESNSGDPFVRRWRPFYGYAVAISWAIQMIGFTIMFVYVGITEPSKLPQLVQQFALLTGSLVTLWGIALAVLGVSVHNRSKDKQIDLENKAKSLFDKIINH